MPELAEDCRDAIQFDSLETALTAFELGPVLYRCRVCGDVHTSAEDPPLACFCRLWSDIQLEISVLGLGDCSIVFERIGPNNSRGRLEFCGLDFELMPEPSWLALNPKAVGLRSLVEACKVRSKKLRGMPLRGLTAEMLKRSKAEIRLSPEVLVEVKNDLEFWVKQPDGSKLHIDLS